MGEVERLCDDVILLQAGRVFERGSPRELIERRVEVLGNISDHMGEVFGELIEDRQFAYAKQVLARLRVQICSDHCVVRWEGEGLSDVVFQCGKVTTRPTQFTGGGG